MSYEEQIMSKDKYPSIFSPKMEIIVFIILQVFFATPAVLKIGEYSRIFPTFSWRIFAHVTRLDQSRASENISWIISMYITAFAPISSIRKQGSFDSEELQSSKWYQCGRENPLSCRKPPFSRAQSLKASEGCTNSHD